MRLVVGGGWKVLGGCRVTHCEGFNAEGTRMNCQSKQEGRRAFICARCSICNQEGHIAKVEDDCWLVDCCIGT